MESQHRGVPSTSFTSTLLHAKAPIYITIGPPCCGKTTLLSQLQQKLSKRTNNDDNHTADTIDSEEMRIMDVSLDDQDGVYIPVDVKYFLYNFANKNDRFLYGRRYIGKTMAERIHEQVELRTVLQRLAGLLTVQEFEHAILQLYTDHIIIMEQSYGKESSQPSQHGNDMTTTTTTTTTTNQQQLQQQMIRNHHLMRVAQDLIHVVEEQISAPGGQQPVELPGKVDLFCVEALFRPNPKTNLTAVEAAAQQLKQWAMRSTSASTPTKTQKQSVSSPSIPLAWGNTNTRPREYKTALEAAVSSGRQVYFIVYYGNHTATNRRVSNGIFLPELEFQELVRRNIQRLLKTGKYIPVKSIYESSCRVKQLINTCINDLDRAVTKKQQREESNDDDGGDVIIPMHTKLDMDKRLVQMANFEMKDDRTIRYAPASASAKSGIKKKNVKP